MINVVGEGFQLIHKQCVIATTNNSDFQIWDMYEDTKELKNKKQLPREEKVMRAGMIQ